MSFRKIVGKIHLVLGLGSGLMVVLISLSGCLYVFSQEFFALAHRELLQVNAVSEKAILPSQAWEKANVALEGKLVRGYFYQQPDRSWAFSSYQTAGQAITYFDKVLDYRTYYLNAGTGQGLGMLNNEYEFFNLVKMFHWSLLLDTPYGQPIVGYSTLVFSIMLLSGLILWWPKSKKGMKQRFSIRWKSQWRRLNYDLHNVPGFYALLLALVLAITGMVWAFPTVRNIVYVVASGTTKAPETRKVSSVPQPIPAAANLPFDKAYRQLQKLYPDAYCFILSQPADSLGTIDAYVQELEGVYWKNASLSFDQYTGRLLHHRPHHQKNTGEQLINANYDIHVGAILGFPGKVLAFLLSLICASLPITGFLLWWGRRNKKEKKGPVRRHTARKKMPLARVQVKS